MIALLVAYYATFASTIYQNLVKLSVVLVPVVTVVAGRRRIDLVFRFLL